MSLAKPLGHTACSDHSQDMRTGLRSITCVPSRSWSSETSKRSTVFLRREDAYAALKDAVRDEPDWANLLFVVPIELDERRVSTN
jgi:hypothetical protein